MNGFSPRTDAMVVVDMEDRLVCCNARFRREWLHDAPVGRENPEVVSKIVHQLTDRGVARRELFFPLWGRATIYAVVETEES